MLGIDPGQPPTCTLSTALNSFISLNSFYTLNLLLTPAHFTMVTIHSSAPPQSHSPVVGYDSS